MENNEISMFMDVKLDINEKKSEASKFKSWTKCLVKIEAIKCFPCYIRLTFVKDLQNDECTDFCVRINIPGLTIRQAASRTKNFSYGIFWKHNRKRCCIFFALDSQISYERHMKWMKKSVKNLELHRQEFIETRRNSKYNIDNNKMVQKRTYKNNENAHKTNLQDILGPLPKIPDSSDSYNWSKRISGFSGIYEEIPDTFEQYQQQNKRNSRRVSRASIASGIYEEMKPIQISNFEAINEAEKISDEGPPLPPPRKRINTLENDENHDHVIPRCNTNPEIEMAKKKKYLQVFETVFGRSKRCDSVSEGKVSTKDDLILNTPKDTNNRNPSSDGNKITKCKNNRFFGLSRTCKKRNSFSSPDLTNLNCLNDEFEDFVFIDSLSLEYDDISETSVCSVINKMSNEKESNESNMNNKENNSVIIQNHENDLNISEQIQSNFNFSCNSSTINLVGANLNSVTGNQGTHENEIKLIDDLSGYCIMVPIKDKSSKKIKNDNEKICNDKDGVVDGNNDEIKENKKQSITSILKDNPNTYDNTKNSMDSCIYENMYPVIEFSLLEKENENNIQKIEHKTDNNQHIYQNIIIQNVNENDQNQKDLRNHTVNANEKLSKNSYDDNSKAVTNKNSDDDRKIVIVSRKSINFDEKIPSYYPNNCDIGKCNRRINFSSPNTNGNSEEKYQLKHNYMKTNKKSNIQSNDEKYNLIINSQKKHNENLYISSPQKNFKHKKVIKNDENEKLSPSSLILNGNTMKPISSPLTVKACKIEKNVYKVTKIKQEKSTLQTDKSNLKNIQVSMENSSSSSSIPKENIIEQQQEKQDYLQQQQQQQHNNLFHRKYATLARLTPNKYLEKSSTNKKSSSPNDLGSLKKFASLPRLKKVDFSPLKLKINAVLQRHRSDGFPA